MIKGGKKLVSYAPAFSGDCKKLLVCTGNTVSLFSVTTGLLVSELEGHAAAVTCVVVVPVASPVNKILCNCWTSSLDGTIRYWDYSMPQMIRVVDIKVPIYSMVIPGLTMDKNKEQSSLYAFVSVRDTKNNKQPDIASKEKKKHKDDSYLHGKVRAVNLTKSIVLGGLLTETEEPENLTVSSSGEFFGIRNKTKLLIWRVPSNDFLVNDVKKMKLHHTKKLSTLAFHPSEKIVAGGDVTGRILVWRGLNDGSLLLNKQRRKMKKFKDEEEMPGVRGHDYAESCSTWHWHSTEVNLLSFSSDGAYLFSGGKEGVLVCWKLDTGKKKFLPRIGSQLLYFIESPDSTISSISCADNQICLLKMPTMEMMKSITGIKLSHPCLGTEGGLNSNRFAFNCSAGILAVPTENYCVQFYNMLYDREISQVQICERNHVPVDDITVFVALVILSADGSMMGTVEVKLPEETIGGLVCLKFWDAQAQYENYSVSTVVYEPHGDAGISAFAFNSTRDMAVSSSYGGNFKVWVRSSNFQQKDGNFRRSGWKCQSVGSYKKRPMTAAGFSIDGTVLAVAAETTITLWNPDTNTLLAVVGETLAPVVALSFAGQSDLVTISLDSKPQLAVWDLSKLSLSWSYQLTVEAVACDVNSDHFAVLTLIPEVSNLRDSETPLLGGRDGLITLFRTDNPIPIATWSVKKAKGGALAFLQASSLPQLGDSSKDASTMAYLAYVNSEPEYIIFNPYSTEEDQINIKLPGRVTSEEESGNFAFESIFGKLPEANTQTRELPEVPFMASGRPWEMIFSESSHILPPLPRLCSEFLSSLLERRPVVES